MDWRYSDKHLTPHAENPADYVNGGEHTLPVTFPWPHTINGPYWIEVRWLKLGERWECVGLSIDFAPGVPVRPLLTADLRRIKMGDLLEYAASCLPEAMFHAYYPEPEPATPEQEANLRFIIKTGAEIRGEPAPSAEAIERRVSEVDQETAQGQKEALQESLRSLPKPRAALSADTLQEVARVYDKARKNGDPPTKAVQEYFGIKKSRAARWVWMCRSDKYKLLPKTEQGRARGNRTEEGE